ncbi:MAG TPA: UDP-galactopyranose mutase [Prevotellaceae bacterium]|nr:UDP-galactopyranose mutase [Prevotellaceae bacterium]
MKRRYDYLIVGSGLMGATFAHLATRAGRRCLVVERREHTGGNIHCAQLAGIHVHQYGAHILHTGDERVWRFVNGLAPCNRYTNSPVANWHGRLYNLPFNMNTFHQMWGVTTPAEARARIEEQRAGVRERLRGREPRNLEEQALTLIGRDIYERLIKGYTEKQWGRKCTELPAFIIRRLPVRMVYDNNYFNDRYQGIPVGGYNRLIDGLLEGVETRTDTDFFADRDHWESIADHVVYTGQLDEFFGYEHGHLNFRTVRFETEVRPTPNYQGNAVVNYTDACVPYTRIIEHKHFECFGQQVYDNPHTVISREYSTEWQPGMEPYYPVNDAHNNALADRYRALAAALAPRVIFGGRLAEYRYYDMAPVIEKVMGMWGKTRDFE